jgi:type IV pilus assembly protein PilQ
MKNQIVNFCKNKCKAFFALSATLLFVTHTLAANSIEHASVSMQGDLEVLRLQFSEKIDFDPKSFSIQSPPRISIDFPGVSSSIGRSLPNTGAGNIGAVGLVQNNEKLRVVLSLKKNALYRVEKKDKEFFLILETGAAIPLASRSDVPVRADTQESPSIQAIKDIDFRGGADGVGRLVISLPNSQMGLDVKPQSGGLVVDILKSTLPQGLRRRLDVIDFGTPVQFVSAVQNGDRVRLTIANKGLWDHSAYQSDTQFVLEVRPQKIDAAKLTSGPGYSGERLSLNFQNIEIRSLLQVIADFTNFNIITSDTVSGAVTLRLQDVPWDQALDIIMQAKSLGMKKNGNVLWIAPKDELASKEKQELEAIASIQNLEPLKTQNFQLNYTKAVEIAAQLNVQSSGQGSARMLSQRGSVIAEPRTNQLFVTDIPERLEKVQQLLTKLDIPVRQVLIEARIVEAADTFGKSLGVRLGGTDLRASRGGDGGYQLAGNNRVAFGTSYANAVSSSGASATTDANETFLNLPAPGQGGYDPARFAVSIFNSAANRFLNLEISALEADGKGKVVSSPRVVTADQTKALIEQGTELPYQIATASGATSIAFRKANLKLEVTPQITPEGNIIMDLDVNKDSVGQSTAAGFAINTKHIKTQVLVENGGTVVIGGIFELTESEAETKVPFLGDLPGLGHLFKARQRTSNKQEMLVFITPKVISENKNQGN